jgi:hypothetical protein
MLSPVEVRKSCVCYFEEGFCRTFYLWLNFSWKNSGIGYPSIDQGGSILGCQTLNRASLHLKTKALFKEFEEEIVI